MAWRTLRGIIATLLVLSILLLLAMGFATLRARDGVTSVFGHPVLTVLSGSMKPTFDPGDVIVDKSVSGTEADHLLAGQVITFREPGSGSPGTLVSHRVVKVIEPAVGSGLLVAYRTRGDNNNVADMWTVTPNDVVGVYQFRVPWLGYVFQDIRTPWAIAVAVVLAALWVGEGEIRRRRATTDDLQAPDSDAKESG